MRLQEFRPVASVSRVLFSSVIGAALLALAYPVHARLSSVVTGPDGHGYQLVDCDGADSGDPDLCPGAGAIRWTVAAEKAAALSYGELTTCHLATPATAKVDDFLKSFPGFEEACRATTIGDLEMCAWIGARDVTPGDGKSGPYRFIDDGQTTFPVRTPMAPLRANPS